MGEIEWQRWLFYLLVGLPLVVWIFLTRDNVMRVLVFVVMLIFVQDTLAARRSLLGISMGPSSMILFTVLAAYLLERGRLPRLDGYGWLWAGFLFFALVGIINGSVGTGLLFFNIQEFQLIYLEGFLVFALGYMAFRSDEEIDRFFRYFILVALGVALLHIFTVATGYRFRAGRITAGIAYAAMFQTTNAMAAFYDMAIPILLVMALRGRLSTLLRLSVFAVLALMGASLFLSASRAGMLLVPVLCVFAVLRSRVGIGRALLAGVISMLVLVSAYWLIVTFLPAIGSETVRGFEEEGLRTGRFATWKTHLGIIFDHPFGVGLAPENLIPVAHGYGTAITNAHNIYLNIAVKTGILGMIVFLTMVTILLRRLLRAMSRAATSLQQQTLTYLFLAVTGFLVAGLIEPIYTLAPKLNQLFWLMSGMSVAASTRVLAGNRELAINVGSESAPHTHGSTSNDGGNEISPWGI